MNSFRIAEITKPYTDYDMIQKHTSLPELAESRANLLLLFLNDLTEDTSQNELITVATSLVQLGLDTHDLVPVNNLQKEEKDARSRQLKVLAGDYFSSRFYHILAKAGQIEMIKQLSNAICEVNRTKMNLYLKMKQQKMTAIEYLEQSVQIKIQLFLSFQHLMSSEQQQIWTELLHRLASAEVLLEEIERSSSENDFQGSWAYWHLLQSASKEEKKQLQQGEPDKLHQLNSKYRSTDELQLLLDKNIAQLTNLIVQIEPESLKIRVTDICQLYLNYQTATEVTS